MLYIAISVTLFALMGGTWLLSKAKTDAMGALAKWIAYLVILVTLGMLVCEIGQACVRMSHCRGSEMGGHGMMGGMKYCPPEMCGGNECYMPAGGGCGMMGGGHCAMMGGHKMHGDMKCCEEGMEKGGKCGDMEEEEEEGGCMMKKDSAAKK